MSLEAKLLQGFNLDLSSNKFLRSLGPIVVQCLSFMRLAPVEGALQRRQSSITSPVLDRLPLEQTCHQFLLLGLVEIVLPQARLPDRGAFVLEANALSFGLLRG